MTSASVAANFTDSPEQCTQSTIFHFKVTTDVLVPCVLSCLLDVVAMFISIPANLLVILAICLNSSLHHNAEYVLLVLVVSDILVSALVQPALFIIKIQHLLSTPSCTTTTVFLVILPIVTSTPIVCQMLVSLERTIAVMAPYWYEEWVTPRRLFLAPVGIWFIWILVDLASKSWMSIYNAHVASSVFTAACILVTLVCYVLLVKTANHHEDQVQAQQQQVQRSEEEKKKQKRERKALWTALYINGAYFVCYLPFISAAVITATVDLSEKEIFLLLPCAGGTIAYFITVANPAILCWRNTRVRREMKKLLRLRSNNVEVVQPRIEAPT